MNPIIWAAIIAAVSTATVAIAANVTSVAEARLRSNAEAERLRDERREDARRERAMVYARLIAVVGRIQAYGGDYPAPTDEQFDQVMREFDGALSEALLAGTEAVNTETSALVVALSRILSEMHRFDGNAAMKWRQAFVEHDAEFPEFSIRGQVIAAVKGRLLGAMRQDVTAPHLPPSNVG